MSTIDAEVRRLVAAAFPDGRVSISGGGPCLPYRVVLYLPPALRGAAVRKRAPDSIATARRFAETAIVLLRSWRERVTQ